MLYDGVQLIGGGNIPNIQGQIWLQPCPPFGALFWECPHH